MMDETMMGSLDKLGAAFKTTGMSAEKFSSSLEDLLYDPGPGVYTSGSSGLTHATLRGRIDQHVHRIVCTRQSVREIDLLHEEDDYSPLVDCPKCLEGRSRDVG